MAGHILYLYTMHLACRTKCTSSTQQQPTGTLTAGLEMKEKRP
jgi:hypothetical protein